MPAWGEIIKVGGQNQKYWPLHPAQSDLLRSEARFLLASAGTGGGKTSFGPIWISKQIEAIQSKRDLRQKPIKGLIIAPTHQVMQRATLPELVSAFQGTKLQGHVTKPSAIVYILPKGMGEIWCLSAERPQLIEGGQFDFGWIDEGGQIRYEAWVAIQGRLGLKQGRCLITTTPYARNWLFARFYKYWEAGDKDYYVRSWRSIDNPAYPREEFERARRTMSPARFAMRYCGIFGKMVGLVLDGFDQCIEKFSVPPSFGVHIGGIDWGFNPDPFVGLAGTKITDKNSEFYDHIFLWYLRYKRFGRIAKHAEMIPPQVRYFADATNPEGIAELRAAGHTAHKNRVKNVSVGIDAMIERVQGKTYHVHPSLKGLIYEAEEYRWQEEEDELIGDEPVGTHHAIDALRYLTVNADFMKIIKFRRKRAA